MKKYFIVIVLLLATGAPSTHAQFDYACNPPCSAGMYCNSDRTCVSISQTLTQQPTSGGININFIKPYSDSIIGVINSILVPVLMAIAFIVFLWGVFKYFIWGKESESDKMEGRKYAMWGVIGFVIILSLWGLVNLVMGTLGFSTSTLAPRPPTI